MRILVPTHAVFIAGGIGTVASGLIPALRNALRPGEEIVVASPRAGHGALVRALPDIGRGRGALARLAYEQIAVPRMAAGCDSVHLLDARPVVASHRPFVLTVHDVSYLDEPTWYRPEAAIYKRWMLAAALAKRPVAVLCDSRHTRERLLAHHPDAAPRAHVVHPGVSDPPADRPPRRPDDSQPYFLTVSTIEPRKNHLGLLRAFRAARARGLHLRWKIAGTRGHRYEPIRAQLAAQEGVDLLGFVSPAELERLYAGALFLALPSHTEGFGYPPLEAMARGVATICSSGSGLDDTVGDAGMRVASDDDDAWTAGLLRLQDDDGERQRLIIAGHEQVRRFDWTDVANELLNFHRTVLAA